MREVGGDAAAWTLDQHLLASVVDAVRWQTFAGQQSHSKRRLTPPTPIPRPGSKGRGAIGGGRGMTPDELRKRLDQTYVDVGSDVQFAEKEEEMHG